MSPIKFKAVRKDNNVFDTFTSLIQGTFEKEPVIGFAQSFWYDESAGFNNPIFVEVIPETLCQFTGLVLTNKTEVFSGDKFLYNGEERYVEYIEDTCNYVLTNGKGFDTRNCVSLTCDSVYGLEVVGNIHDQKQIS